MIERLKKIIKENIPELNVDSIKEDSLLLEDLGIDSIGMMMLSMSMEDEFGVTFEEAEPFVTVKDVLNYLDKYATK